MKKFIKLFPDKLGVLLTANDQNNLFTKSIPYAADNSCFSGFDSANYLWMLRKLLSYPKPMWVTCPDVVADMKKTWRLFHVWAPVLKELNLPVALVLQNGFEKTKYQKEIKKYDHLYDAVFVGGTTAWKLSDFVFRMTYDLHKNGKLVHFGRINSRNRLIQIILAKRNKSAWCDSVDGGSASRWGEIYIPKLVKWMTEGYKSSKFLQGRVLS